MANNNFKAFAAAVGANVMTQADFEALAALLTGFQSGTAQSAQLNKVWRQSSIMAAVLAQFIVDLTGQDAIDDGTTTTLLANLKLAVQAQSAAVVGQARNVAMSVTAASATATLIADEVVVGSALGGKKYVLSSFSKTVNLATTGAGGMDTGSAPVSGYVALYAIYNPSTGASALLARNATSAAQPNVYGGANMPSGYTASALVSVWPTNGSGQFIQGCQADRSVSIAGINVLSTSTGQATLTPLSISGAVPPNAKSVSGFFALATTASSAYATFNVAGNAAAFAQQLFQGQLTNGFTLNSSFNAVPTIAQQTIYYVLQMSAGTLTANVYISAYTF
ncbi:hypothetical protein [Burkholderia sp. LA-2-3-30-S1-D2]|uniref:hypothetical protein n=1 Tax=Burkholderia sp. LA-2-3-30-S1-D2 TaxID=1637862 RepID=UPI000755177D|nr:hypothetical protein [Burkholderia sp. LA-2-3-30-S1-D2]AOI98089.1 hypothetical protein WS66_20770 [Burkholderia sp. LA-2-3-30-S1-D2]KVE14957.1 hypothetical protein WS66_10635 [Burkholderia sp. LA-2-3-30-S1-D2]